MGTSSSAEEALGRKAGGGTVPFSSNGIFVGLFSFLENDNIQWNCMADENEVEHISEILTSQEGRHFLRFGICL